MSIPQFIDWKSRDTSLQNSYRRTTVHRNDEGNSRPPFSSYTTNEWLAQIWLIQISHFPTGSPGVNQGIVNGCFRFFCNFYLSYVLQSVLHSLRFIYFATFQCCMYAWCMLLISSYLLHSCKLLTYWEHLPIPIIYNSTFRLHHYCTKTIGNSH